MDRAHTKDKFAEVFGVGLKLRYSAIWIFNVHYSQVNRGLGVSLFVKLNLQLGLVLF